MRAVSRGDASRVGQGAMRDPFLLLRHLWSTGVDSVSGLRSVARALERDGPFSASLVIAVGKAACSMFLGAEPCISPATRSIVDKTRRLCESVDDHLYLS